MTWNWQDLFALSIVGIAVVYIAILVYRRLRRRGAGGCSDGCFNCNQTDRKAIQLVSDIGTSKSVGQLQPRVE